MLSMVKILLKGDVGGHALDSHGNYIVDHGKIMELCFWISVGTLLWEHVSVWGWIQWHDRRMPDFMVRCSQVRLKPKIPKLQKLDRIFNTWILYYSIKAVNKKKHWLDQISLTLTYFVPYGINIFPCDILYQITMGVSLHFDRSGASLIV